MSDIKTSPPLTATSPPSTVGSPEDAATIVEEPHQNPFTHIGSARRILLTCVFALATAIDVLNISALVTTTASIAEDLDLNAGNITWIITAYTLTFAGFLLFSGRLSDLYPAQFVFLGGFLALGIFLLISSFVTNKYGFLVLRALQGLAGSMTLPSAYHLIVHLYEDRTKQQAALAMLGLAAAVSNSLGIVLGGLFELGNSTWRWLFRFLAILALAASGVGFMTMAWGSTVKHNSKFSKFQRMDIVGASILTISLCLFILGFTSGTTDGWTDVKFFVPFFLSLGLFVGFWVWEYFQHEEKALLPISLMRLPNLIILCFTALTPFIWWGTIQLGFANTWQTSAYGYTPILVAARLLPHGIAGLIGGTLLQVFPKLLQKPKWTVVLGFFFSVVPSIILMIFSDGGKGNDYWKYLFTGFSIGSLAMIGAFIAIQVSIIQALPPSAAGVAGALLQVFLQIGSVIGFSVQAGLFSRVDNDFSRWEGSENYLEFVSAWTIFSMIMFAIFYRPQKSVWVSDTEKVPAGDDGISKTLSKDTKVKETV